MRFASLALIPIVVAVGAQPATSQAPAVINVKLSNYEFTPKTIMLNHGQPYTLRLTNASDGGHDFTARKFFAASAIAPDDRSRVTEGEVEVPPGQVREIRLTAPAAGTYDLKCTHSFHKLFGMSGKIIVR